MFIYIAILLISYHSSPSLAQPGVGMGRPNDMYHIYDPGAPSIDPVFGNRGILIDAGSEGSRMHIFSWQPRVFDTSPPPLSFPESDEKTTERISPGMAKFADNLQGLKKYFGHLISVAKTTLAPYEEHWQSFPFYVKATGGMRLLPVSQRAKVMAYTRDILSDKSFCPFYFQFDFARVISGEEEAAYAWAASNFLFDTLLPNSHGSGAVNRPIDGTYGVVDLGGASTQISFFVPSQDVSESLFKLQIGSQRHWNIYAKSFLTYGHTEARRRHLELLVGNLLSTNSSARRMVNDCFYAGYEESFAGYDSSFIVSGPDKSHRHQFDHCVNSVKPLMEKDLNGFCNKVFDGECSISGHYQPTLPTSKDGHFIGSATYKYPWVFLQMPDYGTLDMFKKRAKSVCAMNYKDIIDYSGTLNSTVQRSDLVPYYCFLSSYITVLLEDGYGFTNNQTFKVVDEINGHKVGWALGSMLYEINGLPFILSPPRWQDYLPQIVVVLCAGIIVGAVSVFFLSKNGTQSSPLRRRKGYDSIPTYSDNDVTSSS